MTQPLHSKSPSFIGDNRINVSWKEAQKPSGPSNTIAAGSKRPPAALIGSSINASKKGRGDGGMQNQLVNRATYCPAFGGRNGFKGRGRGRGKGRGRERGRGGRG